MIRTGEHRGAGERTWPVATNFSACLTEWPGIGKATATDLLYSLKVAYLIFKNAAPILPKAHCLHYKDEPENALYLGEKRCFSGNHTKSIIQMFVPGIIQNPQSNCLFREAYKIHNPAVYSGNHSKSTVQLFVQRIIQNTQSSSLSRESYRIHNPLFWKNARIIAETYATCPNNCDLQIQELRVFVASSLTVSALRWPLASIPLPPRHGSFFHRACHCGYTNNRTVRCLVLIRRLEQPRDCRLSRYLWSD